MPGNLPRLRWRQANPLTPLNLISDQALRHLALNIMRKDTSKGSLRVKFNRAGWKDEFLAQLFKLG